MSIDLSILPAPAVIETLDYASSLAKAKSILIDLMPSIESVMGLESEPAVKILEAIVYIEINLRAHINDALRSNLVALATGSDLDHRAAFYGVSRLPGEDDERLRQRTLIQIGALAGNGTREHYRSKALAVSTAVVDADLMPSPPGQVAVAVWVAAGADPVATLALVSAALQADSAKIIGIPVSVHLARPKPVNVAATLYREHSAPTTIVSELVAALPVAITRFSMLGRDVSESWLNAQLHIAGIARVVLDFPHLELAPDEYAVAGEIVLTDGGTRW